MQRRRIRHGVLLAVLVVLAACTSDPFPDITTDTAEPPTENSNEVLLGVDDASAASLNGTVWEFDEGFGVGEASFPKSITFYRAEGEYRLELNSDCGRATSTIIDVSGGIRLAGLEWASGRRCFDPNEFFNYELQTEIDARGRLLLRSTSGRAANVLRFTHVQSTSIQTDEVPELTTGQINALLIDRSRWEVIEAEGAASAQGLDQIVAFSSISANADVFSVATGCNWQERQINWREDGAILIGGRPEARPTTGLEQPCTDAKVGMASLFLNAQDAIKVQLVDDNTLDLAGDSQNGPWSVRALRTVPQQVLARAACFDYSVAAVVDEPFSATEHLPDGSERTISFDEFVVVRLDEGGADFDGDSSYDFTQLVTLRDVSSGQLVDVVRVCGLEQPIDDIVRIHPNQIVALRPWTDDSTVRVSLSDGDRYHENVYAIGEGSWTLTEEWSVELGSTEYLGPITVTAKPLSKDVKGDPVNGVIRVSWGCISITGADGNSPGLVFPAGRTTWDPVSSAVIVDGVSYTDGQRIGISRLPRPVFLDYFNPMERENFCGIDTHVVSHIWHLSN